MTYTDTVLKPGPNLNMILGPNGTGKSAIVCSIIVGLAGEVSLTGRATNPAGLVKKGSDWGSTEIELFNDRGENYVVQRKILILGRTEAKIDHKSEWKLNNRPALKADIQKLTTKLNIKVDNLCQFLPQDSVAAFVKMNSCELLTSTLKAAGDNQLVEDHEKLIDLTGQIEENKRKLDRLKEDCQHNEVNARRLEADVEKLREREELVKQKAICSSKIFYVKYLETKKNYDDGKLELDRIQDELNQALNSSEPFRRAVDVSRAEEIRLKQIVEQCNNETSKTFELIQGAENSIDGRKIDCQEQFARFKSKQDQENQREQTIRIKQQELESLECRLNETRTTDHSREIKRLEDEIEVVKQKLLQSNRDKAAVEDKLRNLVREIEEIKRKREQINAVRDKKINIVTSRRPDAYRVIDWLARNRDKFRKEVFLPMMCDIDVKDPRDAAVVEHAIQESDLLAFVCQTEEDLKKLTSVARNELNAKINVILKPDKTLQDFENESSQRHQFAGMNFKAYLKDLINAPEPIMTYLYGNYHFNTIPVFNECTESQLKYLLERCRRFYVGSKFYNVSKSRYDNQTMTVADTVRKARYLIFSLDSKRLEECRSEYDKLVQVKKESEDDRIRICKEVDELKQGWQALADQLNELRIKQEEKKRIETYIKLCKDSIKKLRDEKVDIEQERINLQGALKRINHQMMKDVEKLSKIYKNYVKSRENLGLNLLLCLLARHNHKLARKKYENAKADSTRLNEEIKQQRLKLDGLEQLMERMREAAEEKISGFRNKKLDRATSKKFALIEEDTAEAIEKKIEVLKAKIQGICRDPTILSEFEREKQELEDKRQKMSELESSIESMDADRRRVKNTWLPKLNDVISEIDVHYRDFMRKLSYDGQVKLDYDQSRPDNFSVYGIMIMVKYRDNEQLIPLSSTRQSGGERSVATMIYMLALQTKTTVPFRCVDEINQGMDKENERKVFELLVQTADESSSQYFLVSPKLLSNLPYSEKMKIHVVFNGKKLDLAWNELGSDGTSEDDGAPDSETDTEA